MPLFNISSRGASAKNGPPPLGLSIVTRSNAQFHFFNSLRIIPFSLFCYGEDPDPLDDIIIEYSFNDFVI